jgi:histone-lysine N-methyltransferase SETMAR
MEEFIFTTSQKRAASEVKCQDDAHFFVNGIVHSEFVPNGETVNQAFYLQVLKRLRDMVRRKCPELWQSGEWWLHHDNAPAHKALSVQQFLTKNRMTQLLHPPYSHDLAPCDFLLFRRMKKVLKGKRFADVEEVKKERRRH